MRARRLWEPGDILSVVGRAHEGRPIFAAEDDRRFFVDRLRLVFVPGRAELLAWALLVNHYHLMVRVVDAPPETLFRRLNTAVGMRERRRRGDHGAVFQGRYWSRPCDGEGSVVAVLTYVLGNPVHHGVVPTAEALETYEWTAYPEILGRASPGVVDAEATLGLLHPDPRVARGVLRDAMDSRVLRWWSQRDGIDVCEEPGCRGFRDGCALVHAVKVRRPTEGDPLGTFPARWRPYGISRAHDERADRQARLRAHGWTPDDVVGPLCARLGADADAVRAGGRGPAESAARAVIAFVACDGAGVTGSEAAALLGVTDPAITAARRRGADLLLARGWSVDEALSWRDPGQ